MVPPISVGNAPPLKRTGPQRTYVFHDNGVETIVIRPGYAGKVTEFGMLVPLPSLPAIRKAPDEIFSQLAAAVDPPEVVVQIYDIDRTPRPMAGVMSESAGAEAAPAKSMALARDDVRVLKEEAVGMYEMAVLEAGSPKALQKWMDEHKFAYPKGMEAVVDDYVKLQWVFVAVRARIGSRDAAGPKPGMKTQPSAEIPAGASFDGYLQGMGFRFKVAKPIVPMRLATFNEADDRRQVVYALTREGVKLDGVDEAFVKRQVDGKTLRKNLTDPLPIRVINGKLADLPPDFLAQIAPQRNPALFNGEAKELFAADLIAARSGEMELGLEKDEKDLLEISERLNLRGEGTDQLFDSELKKKRDAMVADMLKDLDGMTLTVIDGQPPLELMRDHDITFAKFKMTGSKNTRATYNANSVDPQLTMQIAIPYYR